MAAKLKILYLENDPVDVKLVRLELKKALLEFTMRSVGSKNDFERGIDQYKPDLVLSDYNLPGYDGISAMKYCIKKDPDLPFIMVTGSLDEESAVGVMKMGAWDYVLKENLHRLEPGIKNALKLRNEKLKSKEAFEALKRSEEKYRSLFERSGAGMFRAKFDGSSFLTVNQKLADILKYPLKTIRGMKTAELWWRDAERIDFIHKLKEEKVVNEYEIRMKAKDGRMVKALISARLDYAENIIEGSLMDVTQHRREEMIREVIYNISDTAQSETSLKELLITTNFELTRVVPTRNFFIGLVSQDKKYLSIPYMRDDKDQFDKVPLKDSVSGWVFNEKKTLRFNRSGLEKRIKKEKLTVHGTLPEIWIGVPLKVNQEVMGVMVIQDYQNAKAFNKDDVKLFEYVSTQLAQLIQRKQSRDEIRKLQQGIEQNPVSIVITDVEGNIEYVNPKFLEVTQFEWEEVFHQNPRILQSGQTPKETYEDLWDTVTRGKTWKGEFLNRKRNGELYIESATISPILDENGKVQNYIGLKEDITDLKKMQVALVDSEKRFKSITEKAHDGIFIMDGAFNISYWNEAVERITGYSKEELLEGKAKNLVKIAARKLGFSYERIRLFEKTGKLGLAGKAFDFTIQTKKGDYVPLNVILSSIFLQNRWYAVAIIRDVSERVKHEKELKAAKKMAEEANRLKIAFLANMSHELKTPLNSIIGFSELLKHSNNLDDLEDFAVNISRSGYQLLEILNNILHASLLESRNLKLKKSHFDSKLLENRIPELQEEIATRYEKEALTFRLKRIKGDSPLTLETDKNLVVHLVRNLLDNAYKFTEKGLVEMSFSVFRKNLVIEVKDTGIGINEDQKDVIFEPFRQGEEAFSRQYGGTGLGLSLVKGFVELMGGNIKLKSKPGEGSAFTVTLPIVKEEVFKDKQKPEVKPGKDEINLVDRKIMVVEDEEINYLLLRGILSRQGAQLIRAKNGQEGIQRYRENPDIDLVLMDIRMPVMNGLDATRALKKIKRDLPVIAITAYTMPEDKIEAFQAGCDEFLTKPVKRDILFQVLLEKLKL